MEGKLRLVILFSGVLFLVIPVQSCSPLAAPSRRYRVNRLTQVETDEDTIPCPQPESKRFRNEVNGCSFDLDRASITHPPHIVSGAIIVQPELQNGRRIIMLTENEQVTIACEENKIIIFDSEFINATCHSGSLVVADQYYPFSSFGCASKIRPSVRETGNCGAQESSGKLVEIGWKVKNTWINQIACCHNPSKHFSFYAVHTLVGHSVTASEKGHDRAHFRKGGYFTNIDINRAFTDQYATATRILGKSVDRYFDAKHGTRYLARAHLTPFADFADEGSQDATQYYVNALPQWQVINNGVWRSIEASIRELAAQRRANFTIYTGGYGLLTLSSDDGTEKELFLGPDPGMEDEVPVPKFFWKIVLDASQRTGTAFVTINNPYKTALQEGDVICEDRCSSITWPKLQNRLDFTQGYTYCCTVEDLHKAVPLAPNLSVPLLV